PERRVEMLRNRRGAMSLRWLRALLDHGVEVHGQIVVCPALNDGDVLDETLCGVLDEYPELADVAVVPLGVSRFNKEPRMRPHSVAEAERVCDVVDRWQEVFLSTLGHRMVFAADEYYLLAGRPFPDAATYGDFSMHEDGIGMARAFEAELDGTSEVGIGIQSGVFHSVDGAPPDGYRAPRTEPTPAPTPVALGPRRRSLEPEPEPEPAVGPEVEPEARVAVLTGPYGARILTPLIEDLLRREGRGGPDDAGVRVVEVENRFFGGNVGVAGLMVGED